MKALKVQKLPLQELGGSTFLEGKSLVFAAVVSFATSMSTFSGDSFPKWTAWALGNLAAFLVVLIPVWGIWWARRRYLGLVIPWILVAVISFCLGVLKAAVVVVVFSWLVDEPVLGQELIARSFVGGVIGLITLPMLSLATMALLQIKDLNQKLGDRVDVEFADASRPEASLLLGKLVAQINRLLVQLRRAPEFNLSTADVRALRELIESGVRPTSHAYWSESNVAPRTLSWKRLLELAYGQPIWIWPVLLPLAIGSLVSQVEAFGIFPALQKVAFVIFLSALVLTFANQWLALRKRSAGLWFFTAMAFAGPAAWLLAAGVTRQIELADLRWFFGYSGWLVAGSLFSSAARLLARERAELSSELNRLRLLDSRFDSEFRREARRKANQIHGEIQSQLVSTALLAEAGTQIQRQSLIRQLEVVLDSLQQPHDENFQLSERFDTLVNRWRGFIEIDLTLDQVRLNERLARVVFSVVEEACLNAYRHGLADHCRVEISAGDPIEISVQDNGVGLRSGPPGLGTSLFADLDPNWSLDPGIEGGTLLQVRIVNFV
jgi:two-component sensor histidine kinase